MADHKVEPVAVKASDVPQPNGQATSSSENSEARQKPSSSSEAATMSVRKSLLDAVVVHQAQRISELERLVEKKKAKLERLSSPQPFLHPSALGVIPSPAAQATVPSANVPSPASQQMHPPSSKPASYSKTVTATTAPQQHPPQPPPHNPTMAAAMAAVAAAATPPASTALHAPYPFLFPHPDNPTMAATLMGVVPPLPPHPAPPPMQPVAPPPSSQPVQSSDAADRKQSRYWTADEHQRFLAAVNACGPKNYNQISEYVGTRNAKQVRTHAQKFQKRLEREEAKRRGDVRTGAASDSNAPSVGAAAAAAVAAAAAAAMHGSVPGTAAGALHVAMRVPAAPNSTSSKSALTSPARATKSSDGSSSTNNASSEGDAENRGDDVHAEAAAAAAAAVAAEAAALGGGRLPLEALSSLSGAVPGSKTNPNLEPRRDETREQVQARPKVIAPSASQASNVVQRNCPVGGSGQTQLTPVPASSRASALKPAPSGARSSGTPGGRPGGRGAENHILPTPILARQSTETNPAKVSATPSTNPSGKPTGLPQVLLRPGQGSASTSTTAPMIAKPQAAKGACPVGNKAAAAAPVLKASPAPQPLQTPHAVRSNGVAPVRIAPSSLSPSARRSSQGVIGPIRKTEDGKHMALVPSPPGNAKVAPNGHGPSHISKPKPQPQSTHPNGHAKQVDDGRAKCSRAQAPSVISKAQRNGTAVVRSKSSHEEMADRQKRSCGSPLSQPVRHTSAVHQGTYTPAQGKPPERDLQSEEARQVVRAPLQRGSVQPAGASQRRNDGHPHLTDALSSVGKEQTNIDSGSLEGAKMAKAANCAQTVAGREALVVKQEPQQERTCSVTAGRTAARDINDEGSTALPETPGTRQASTLMIHREETNALNTSNDRNRSNDEPRGDPASQQGHFDDGGAQTSPAHVHKSTVATPDQSSQKVREQTNAGPASRVKAEVRIVKIADSDDGNRRRPPTVNTERCTLDKPNQNRKDMEEEKQGESAQTAGREGVVKKEEMCTKRPATHASGKRRISPCEDNRDPKRVRADAVANDRVDVAAKADAAVPSSGKEMMCVEGDAGQAEPTDVAGKDDGEK